MLGAQARAAEYTAARNASARQASREAEDQKLPPKSAPVSLGAFTKNVQINRNKGNKGWIPLVLDEIDEEENSSPLDNKAGPAPNVPQTSDIDFDNLMRSNFGMSADHVGVNIPQNHIPSAPRALIKNPIIASRLGYPSPTQQEQHYFTGGQSHNIQSSFFVSPRHGQNGMYPESYRGWIQGSPAPLPAAHTQKYTPEGLRRMGGLMVPTDITPTKQEQKLSMLSHSIPNPLSDVDGATHVQESKEQNHKQSLKTVEQMHKEAFEFGWELMQYRNEAAHTLLDCLPPHRLHFDAELHRKGVATHPFVPINLISHTSTPNDRTKSLHDARRVPTYTNHFDTRYSMKGNENEEPYDRSTKLQQFAAAQKALARTGKTVLHNPEVRKRSVKGVNLVGDDHTDDQNMTPSTNIPSWQKKVAEAALMHATKVSYPPPSIAPTDASNTSSPIDVTTILPADAALHHEFSVHSSAWLQLKPVTRKERMQMSNTMSDVALKVKNEEAMARGLKPTNSGINKTNRSLHIDQWLKTDPRGHKAARETVNALAYDYSRRQCLMNEDPFQDFGATNEVVDVHGGKVRAIGNVLANLTEQIVESQSGAMPQDYFNRIKPAPEFSIATKGTQNIVQGDQSYFDTDPTLCY